jgi:UDP-GlcNAc:undecaprenyl-phosphate GlcNAc-1-phosphate transferase
MFDIIPVGFILAALISLAVTPPVIKFAVKIGAIDRPDSRKIHSIPTPRLGGVGIFISFLSALVIIQYFYPEAKIYTSNDPLKFFLPAVSLTLILITGICDDIKNLKPGEKFLLQIIAATLVCLSGIKISSIMNPFTGELIAAGIFSYPLTILWITGITNAFNLIDGLDGLAAGIAVIAALTIFAISLINHDLTSAVTGIVLAGSLFGFLHFNFNPAKIFLGDSGSLFAGFSLAVLSIQSSTKGSTAFSIIIALLALGVPIIDTLLAISRRILKWFLPGESSHIPVVKKLHSMFLPDKRHIHHQLLASGFSQRAAVLLLYLVSSALGVCAVLISTGSLNASFIIVGLVIFLIAVTKKLGYKEMALFRNGIFLKFYNGSILKHPALQFVFDLLSIPVAFLFAYYLTVSTQMTVFFDPGYREVIAAVIIMIIQMITFVTGGLYKRKIVLLGLGDFLQILRVVFIAVLISALYMNFTPFLSAASRMNVLMMIDFYSLISLVAGSRILFHALNYLFKRDSYEGKKILIYGADWMGMIALQTLLQIKKLKKVPVGFIDDDPELEGKFLNGYPIFGGHWKLEGLVNKRVFDEIILTKENPDIEAFKRVRAITEKYKLPFHISRINFEELAPGYYKNKGNRKLSPVLHRGGVI